MIVNLWHESFEGTVPFKNVVKVHFDYCTDTFTLIYHDGHSQSIPLTNIESIEDDNKQEVSK